MPSPNPTQARLIYLSAADGSAGIVCKDFEGAFIANWSGSGVICQYGNRPWPGVDHRMTDEAGARAFIKHERYRAGFMRGKERDEYEFDLASAKAERVAA